MFFNSKSKHYCFAVKGHIKYFVSIPPESGWSGDGKRTIFKAQLNTYVLFPFEPTLMLPMSLQIFVAFLGQNDP